MIGRRAPRSPPATDTSPCTALRPTRRSRSAHCTLGTLTRTPSEPSQCAGTARAREQSHRHTGTRTRTTFRQALIGPRLRAGGSWGQGVRLMIEQGLGQLRDAHTSRRDFGRCSPRAATAARREPTALQPCCSRLRSLETTPDLQACDSTSAAISSGCAGRRRWRTPQWARPSAAGRVREA